MKNSGKFARGAQLAAHQLFMKMKPITIAASIWLGCFLLVYGVQFAFSTSTQSLASKVLGASLLSVPVLVWMEIAARRRVRELFAELDARDFARQAKVRD